MKTRPHSLRLLVGAAVLLLGLTLAWLRGSASSAPTVLTSGQNAAIQAVHQILLYDGDLVEQRTFLPLITR